MKQKLKNVNLKEHKKRAKNKSGTKKINKQED